MVGIYSGMGAMAVFMPIIFRINIGVKFVTILSANTAQSVDVDNNIRVGVGLGVAWEYFALKFYYPYHMVVHQIFLNLVVYDRLMGRNGGNSRGSCLQKKIFQ